MKPYRIFLLVLLATSTEAGEIALTFDDAPRPSTQLFSGEERTQTLIENLKKANVADVLMFITTKNINEKSKNRISAYVDAGFHIANHSHAHLSANKSEIETYLEDISTAHENLKTYENVIPFFRYPFLHKGSNIESRDRIRRHLKNLGYENGYVTVDNFDWYMDSLLQKALKEGKQVNYDALKDAYISTLWDSIVFYDEIGQAVLGRSPKHVMLLHENDLAAMFIDDLVEHIRDQGWQIITHEEAYQDDIAKTIPDVLFNGQGRVAAIAKSKGWDEKRLRDEGSNEEYLDRLFKDHGVFK